MDKVKILLITNPNPYGSGAQRRNYKVIKQMLLKPEVDLHLLIFNSRKDRTIIRLFKTNDIEYKNILIIKEYNNPPFDYILNTITNLIIKEQVYQYAKNIKPDLIVAHDETLWYMILAYKISKKISVPYTFLLHELPVGLNILEPHVSSVIDFFDIIKGFFKLAVGKRYFINKILKNTTPILISKSILHRLYSLKIPLQNYLLLKPPIGIDLENINAAKKLDPHLGCDALYIARLIPEKGIYDLIKIWSKVVEVKKDSTLCIIGRFVKNKHKKDLKNLIFKHNLQKNIKMLGFISDTLKYSILKSSKLFLYPSRQDSFGIVVLEALACGIPAVTYNIPAMYYNFPTDSVIKVPVGDHRKMANYVISLLSDEQQRKNLSKEGIKFASKYTWKEAVESEIEAYNKLI